LIYKDKLQTVEKPLLLSKNWVEGRSPPTGTRGGSPTLSHGTDAVRVCPRALQGRKANQAYTVLHHGEGVWGFGKDAEIERPKALQDAKPTKRSYRDREFALFFIKADFFSKM
jgi:hypothetical protein